MVSPGTFSRVGKIYLWGVICAGILVLATSIADLIAHPIAPGWLILAILTLASGSATLQLPSSYASITISETFVFAAALLYGPSAAAVTVSLDALTISFWISKRHRDQGQRALFNMSAPVISAWVAANVFFGVSKIAPLSVQPSPVNAILPPLFLFALLYFAVNSWLVTFVIALERALDPLDVWRSSFVWLSLNYFGGASVAILFVGVTRTIDIGYLGIILPLLLVLYFTFKTTMGRVEDANKHVEQLNQLYMSTIETLAMAIDAKDQVTHGHIRRVQLYAMRLAKEIGLRDSKLIKAVEAAALLHDMGKLAVPEYILNKPGKLTSSEFEKMKLHASIGADILTSIDFPYPVVPIVRHHHENWNGTGYPDGLKGTAIPIGARILAVVDCFDALTSDRPYRPKLSTAEAIQILVERRGSMYDPLIVDTFCRVHGDVVPGYSEPDVSTDALNTIAIGRSTPTRSLGSSKAIDVVHHVEEPEAAWQIERILRRQSDKKDLEEFLVCICHVVPFSLGVLYACDANWIEARYAVGEDSDVIRGMRIPLGQRLSGWVAAHRQTIANSDPALDLREAINEVSNPLKGCASTPLITEDDQLIGVLTLYVNEPNTFTDRHIHVLEVIGPQIARAMKGSEVTETLSLQQSGRD